jgi:hypothetical protein
MTTGRPKARSTDKLARAYSPEDPRYERNARLGGMRAREQATAVAAATEAAAQAQGAVADAFDLTDLVGTSFPEGPVAGRPFCRSDLGNEWFIWNETTQKWLGTMTASPSYTNGTTLTSGNNLRLFQGPAGSGTLGYRLEWDCTLVSVVASRGTSGAATQYDIRAATTVRKSHTLGAGVVTSNESSLNIDFSANEVVNVILASDMTGGGTITCIFRRRAT